MALNLRKLLLAVAFLLATISRADEDGKTPLDKARERNDEGHREVAQILQSPADFIPSTQDVIMEETACVCRDICPFRV